MEPENLKTALHETLDKIYYLRASAWDAWGTAARLASPLAVELYQFASSTEDLIYKAKDFIRQHCGVVEGLKKHETSSKPEPKIPSP